MSHEPVFCFWQSPPNFAEWQCTVHDNGPVFHGLPHQGLVFADVESVHVTRDVAGQVLGQFFWRGSGTVCSDIWIFAGCSRLSDGVWHDPRRGIPRSMYTLLNSHIISVLPMSCTYLSLTVITVWTERRVSQSDHFGWSRVASFPPPSCPHVPCLLGDLGGNFIMTLTDCN